MANQETRAKIEAPRGNERIQQLMEEFPEVPRTIVVKTDLIREGLRPSVATRQIGRWSLPDARDYFDFDKEDTHTPDEAQGGYIRTPIAGYFGDGVTLRWMLDSRSPYEIRYEERGRYRLYRDGEPIEEVFFPPRPQWYDRRTSSGKPMPSVIVERQEGWLQVAALVYCGYAKDDLLCRYCNINASESVSKGLGLERLTAKRDQDLYEAMLAACQESKVDLVVTSGGVMLDSSQEADNYARIVKVLRQAEKDAGHQTPIRMNVLCQAMEEEDQRKLKEAGASSLAHNLEVWDPRLFEIICPGKAKYVGQQRWIERTLKAVEIFGKGRVTSDLVVGVELAHPGGFKSEDEAAASQLESVEWLLSHGIGTAGVPFRCAPGTMFEGRPSPRTEYFLRVELARYKAFVKYNMLPEPGKGFPSNGTSITADFLVYGLRGASAAGASQACALGEVC